MVELTQSPIIDFYKNKSVFITGGTGFLGMVLIEKLLFSCGDIKHVYMLVKPKRGKSVQERFTDLTDSQVFQRLKEQNPKAIEKLIPITGDILEENIGISEKDRRTLQREVSLVFHVAANIQFNLSLSDAINANTRATEKMIQLSKGMPHLMAFVYVSTAYSNCNRKVIAEKIYYNEFPVQFVCDIVDELGGNPLIENMLEGKRNTYTYSKALAEELVANHSKEIPAVIVRPAIVLSSLKEPVRGWIKGMYGANQVTTGVGKGVIRCWNGDPEAICDVVPVDIVANLLIAAAWDTHRRRDACQKEVKVLNCSSGLQNPLTLGALLWTTLYYSKIHFKKFDRWYRLINLPLYNAQRVKGLCYKDDHSEEPTNVKTNRAEETFIKPTLLIIKNRVLYLILFWLLQIIPAYIIEVFLRLLGRKQSILKITNKLRQLELLISFFTLNQFAIVDRNSKELYHEMSELDQKTFNITLKNIDWDDYLESYILGIKKYILKENQT